MTNAHGMTPEQLKNAGLSQEDVEPNTPPKGQAGDSEDEIVDDYANDTADNANDVKATGMGGI